MADDKAHATDVTKIVEAEIVSDATMQKVEELIEAEEGAANRLVGWAGIICTGIAVSMSLFHLYAAYAIVPTQELRYIHVAFTLILAFLLFPVAKRFRDRLRWWDIVPGVIAIVSATQIKKFTQMCGAKIPPALGTKLEALGTDDAAAAEFGIEYCTKQCEELLKAGVPGLHFYTLNKAASTVRVLQNLKLA